MFKFQLNISKAKHHNDKKDVPVREIKSIFTGTCIFIDDVPKIKVIVNNHEQILDVTPRSFDLKGKRFVFSHEKDDYGKYKCYCRTDEQSKYAPGNPDLYTPFCNNWNYSGYVCTLNGIRVFDVKTTIGVNHHQDEDSIINE